MANKQTKTQKRRAKKLRKLGLADRNGRLLNRGYETVPTAEPGVTTLINREPDNIHRYFNRGVISAEQFDAAKELYECWFTSGRGASTVARYDIPTSRTSGSDESARQVAAEIRFKKLMGGIGQQLASVLLSVVLLDFSAADWARQKGRKPDDGVAVLRFALDHLVEVRGVARHAN